MSKNPNQLMLDQHSAQLNRHRTLIYLIGVAVCLIWEFFIGFVLATRAVDLFTLIVLLAAALFQLVCLAVILFVSKSTILTTVRIWCGVQLLLLALISINYIFGSQQQLIFSGTPPVALIGNHLVILLTFLLLDSLWAFRLTAASCALLMAAFLVHLSISSHGYINRYALMWPVFIVFISNPLMIGILAAYQKIRDSVSLEYELSLQRVNKQSRARELDASRDPVSHLPNRKGILSDLQELIDNKKFSGAFVLQVRGLHVARKNLPDFDYYDLTKNIGLWMAKTASQWGARTGLVESGELMTWWTSEEELNAYAVAEELLLEFSKQDFANRDDFKLQGRGAALSAAELEIQTPSVVLEELKFRLFLAESRGVGIVQMEQIH